MADIFKENKIAIKRQVMEFLSTLFNCVGVYIALFPFIKGLGFINDARYNDLVPLNRFTAAITNSLFLYLCGCLVLFAGGILYNWQVLRRISAKSFLLAAESILSLIFVAVLWFLPLKEYGFLVLALRCLLTIVLIKLFADREVQAGKFARSLSIVFYFISAVLLALFLRLYLWEEVFSKITWYVVFKAAVLIPILLWAIKFQDRIHRFIYFVLDGIVLASLSVLVFKNDFSYFDYSAFLGAVNDVILKKDILDNIIVSYGYFNVYFVAVVFDVFKVADYYLGLSILISVLLLLGYASIYIFLRIYTRNFFLSLALLYITVEIDFYCLHIPLHWLPQSTFLRFGSYLPVLYFLYALNTHRGKITEWLFALLTAVMFFWAIEYGVYMIVAAVGITFCHLLFQRGDAFKCWLARLGRIGVFLLFICVYLTAYIWMKYGHWPVWLDLVYFPKLYSQSGLAMNQLNTIGIWVIPFVVYWTTIYVCLKYYRKLAHGDTWLFLSFFGLLFFIYFIGKGGGFVLARTVLPVIILSGVFLGFLSRQNMTFTVFSKNITLKNIVYGLVIFLSLLISDTVLKEGKGGSTAHLILTNPKVFTERSKIPPLARFLKTENNFKKFQVDVRAIDLLVAKNQPLALLSKNDTLYYVYAKRKSLFNNAFYPHFATRTQLEGEVDTILESNVKFIFIDNSSFQCYENLVTEQNKTVFEGVRDYYVKRATLGFLDVYERIRGH